MKKKMLLLFLIILTIITQSSFAKGKEVFEIPITGTINPGVVSFVSRGVELAEESNAQMIIFRINTYGGLLDSGIKIKDIILDSSLPTITYVDKRAWSAGALIALAGDKLIMEKGSSIGAAETIPKNEKYISAVRKEFAATAGKHSRNTKIAESMVDADIEIEGIIESGKLLTLTAGEALENKITNYVVNDYQELLKEENIKSFQIVEVELQLYEKLARLITNPYVSAILLTIAFIALIIEAIAPGWGVGGTISLLSIGLFFSGYSITGGATAGLITLFFIGVVLILIEIFVVPGFGITGIGGMVAIFGSLFFVFPTTQIAIKVISIVLLASLVSVIILIRIFGTSKLWSKISLNESQKNDKGYVSSDSKKELIGKKGVVVSLLRPAGFIEIDGEKINVVSEGEYIEKGKEVEVVKVVGSRIVVKKLKEVN